MGVIDRVGPNVTNLQIGQRVVASFQIACGECSYCKKKLSSMCDRTNNSSLVVLGPPFLRSADTRDSAS
jgi:threonine dehydrogenase-like Zn-dependent dehydrogenase